MKLTLYSSFGGTLVSSASLRSTRPRTRSISPCSRASRSIPRCRAGPFPVLFLGFAVLGGIWPLPHLGADRPRRGADAPATGGERRPVHHAPARGDHDPRRARHGHHDARRGAAARHRRGHLDDVTASVRTSARTSRTSSTASPSPTRSSSATRPRPRRCARWSSRWPATRGCW